MIWVGPTKKSKGTSTKKRREISVHVPTENLDNKSTLTAAEIILPNASITMINNKEDKGFPCLKPQELLKKPVGEPFTKNREPHQGNTMSYP